MTATAKLKQSLYAAQEAWRPVRRRKGASSGKAVMLFPAALAPSRPSLDAAKAQVERFARRAPQVLVKVSKSTYGAAHTCANFTYISRNGKVPLYDQDGVEITDVDAMRDLAEEWRALNFDPADLDSRFSSPDARRIILSMPKGTDADVVLHSARAMARDLFADNYDYVLALHIDEGKGGSPNPHVHLTVRAKGHDGTKLVFAPADLLHLRRTFATELRQRNVDADATPQIARGPRLNNEHSKVHYARKRVEDRNFGAADAIEPFRRDLERLRSGADREFYSEEVIKLYQTLLNDLTASSDPAYRTLSAEFRDFLSEGFAGQIAVAAPELGPKRAIEKGDTIPGGQPSGPKPKI